MKFKSRLSRNAGWLIPGLQVKRWLFLVLVGAVFIALGLAILFDAKPISFIMDMVKLLAGILPSAVSGLILLGFGGILFLKGWLNANSSVLQGIDTKDQGHVLERLYRRRMLDKGPKIVAIGGGTGLSTILKGLKHITNNLTAIVTVGDDGGSSGRLRKTVLQRLQAKKIWLQSCSSTVSRSETVLRGIVSEIFSYQHCAISPVI